MTKCLGTCAKSARAIAEGVEGGFGQVSDAITSSYRALADMMTRLRTLGADDAAATIDAISMLRDAAVQSKSVAGDIVRFQDEMAQCARVITAVRQSLQTVEGRYQTLTALCIPTLVYGRQLGTRGDELVQFGQEMVAHSAEASHIASSMLTAVMRFEVTADASAVPVEKGGAGIGRGLDALTSGLEKGLSDLDGYAKGIAAEIADLERQNEGLISDVSTCVTLIQFADACNQRLTHVETSCLAAADIEATGAAALFEGLPLLDDAEREEVGATIRRVSAAQTDAVAGDLAEQALALETSIAEITGVVRAFSGRTASISKGTAAGQNVSVVETLRKAQNDLSIFGRSVDVQTQAIAAIIETIEEMQHSARLLDGMRAEMFRSAVNAIIIAERLSGEGRAFGVVAKEIMSIARQNEATISMIEEQFAELSRVLDAIVSRDYAADGGSIHQVTVSVAATLDSLSQADRHRDAEFESYVGVLRSMGFDLMDAARSSQAMHQFCERLQGLRTAILADVARDAGPLSGPSLIAVEHIKTLYTMRSETDLIEKPATGTAATEATVSEDDLADILF